MMRTRSLNRILTVSGIRSLMSQSSRKRKITVEFELSVDTETAVTMCETRSQGSGICRVIPIPNCAKADADTDPIMRVTVETRTFSTAALRNCRIDGKGAAADHL